MTPTRPGQRCSLKFTSACAGGILPGLAHPPTEFPLDRP